MPSLHSSAMLLLLGMLPGVMGHSFLGKPASRNLLAHIAGEENCPHCMQSGGPDNVKERGGGIWPPPPGSHGLCGDPVQGASNPLRLEDETYLKAGQITATYRPGEIAEFHIVVSTHHRGHYEFRICDRALDAASLSSAAEGQACLDGHLLQRAPPAEDCVVNDPRGDCQPLDPKHPERWYLPPAGSSTQQAGSDFNDSMAPEYPSASEIHVMRFKIPEDLSCSSCTLQWYWSSGNSCYYDGDYFDYFRMLDGLGWNVKDWDGLILESWNNCDTSCCKTDGAFGEEFWNCADIAVLGDAISTTATSTMSSTSGSDWEPVDGGDDRACRGANSGDNSGSYYSVVSQSTLDDCKASCMSTAGCVGIEYGFSSGRCEIWTRPDGIRATITSSGRTCLRYSGSYQSTTTPILGPFEPVDGGEGRACRGANSVDNSASYFDVYSGTPTLDACKVHCASTVGCVGIEYNVGGRCEVWTRPDGIRASAAVSASFACYRYGTLPTTTTPLMGSFQAVDGGDGRACRGATAGDNSASYYTVHPVATLEDCKIQCSSTAECVGIEYNMGGRCEVWTRAAGIEASKAVAGFSCFRYTTVVTTTATTTVVATTTATTVGGCASAWDKCGGNDFTGPTCCVPGYACERESQWYSQCRPASALLQAKARSRRQHFLGTAFLQNGDLLRKAKVMEL